MKLNLETLGNSEFWKSNNVILPGFDVKATAGYTLENPVWVHFGAGSLFRAFHALVMQELLNK